MVIITKPTERGVSMFKCTQMLQYNFLELHVQTTLQITRNKKVDENYVVFCICKRK